MAAPTPWQASRTLPQPTPQPRPTPRRLPTGRSLETWPYAVAAIGSIAVFLMLFETWMIAPNRSGSNAVDAFGTTHTTTTHLNLWSQHQPPGVSISGVWGILATIAVFITVFAAVQAIYRGTQIPGLITAISAVAVAVFVIIDLFYIRSKMYEAQAAMKMSNDLAGQLGLAISALRGTSSYPWPGVRHELAAAQLTPWAYVAAAIAFGSAGVAATRTWYSGLHEAVGRSWTQRQTRSIGQWLSEERSLARTAAPRADSTAPDSEPTKSADDRDWGAAG